MILLTFLLFLSIFGASAQGGKGKFLTIYNVNGQEVQNSSTGISFVRDNQTGRYAWRPIDSPWATYSSLGESFNIENVTSIFRYVDSDNHVSVDIPSEANLSDDDIIVKAYGDEITPSQDNDYSTGASYVSVVNKDGRIIYDSYLSLDENDDTRAVEVNALETAYTLLIPIFPFVFEPTSDQILSTLKGLLSELPETHALADAIDRSIIKNGYLVMGDIDAEYNTAVETVIGKMGLRDNYLRRRNIRRVKPYDFKDPYVVNGKGVYGLKLEMNEGSFDWIGPRWHCSFTAYNSNRFAYTAWLRGYKTDNGVQYYNDEDMETLMKRILKPQRVSTFMGTFTSWEGIKDYVSDSYRLFTEEGFGFDDMTWDNTKLNFDMYFYSEKDVVIVAGPANNEFMLYYNILKVVLGPVVKAFTKGINKLASNATDGQSELYESDYLIPFITDLLTDVDYKFNFQAIYESDESLGEKAGAILELTWPKFQTYLEKFAVEQFNLIAEREAIKYFGFFTTAQLRRAMEDIGKNWNKYLKVVEKVGDATLGVLGLTEGSYFYDIAIDFGPDDPLTLNKYQVNVEKGKDVYIPISSGNGNYKVETSDSTVATAIIKDVGSSSAGGLLYSVIITGVNEGKCGVTVTDTRLQKATIEVEVTDGIVQKLIKVEPKEVDFGQVEVGSSKSATFTVSNVGTASLTVTVANGLDEGDDCVLIGSGQQFTLAVGQSKTFTVTYTPTQENSGFNAIIRILSDAENDTEIVTVSGRSYKAADNPVGTETITVNGVSFTMVSVDGGTFWMGSPDDDGDASSWERPLHEVTLSSFAIGQTEVTQELWEAVMGTNPSYFKGSSLPVEGVSCNDCQEFLTKLNALTGRSFRLPTEAEWEYAARGGSLSRGYKYAGSDDIEAVAWYRDNSGNTTHTVGTKAPNELGLYDMSGNVRECCQDWLGYYANSPSTDPCNKSVGSYRMNRGGSYTSFAKYCRVAIRRDFSSGYWRDFPDHYYMDHGLRLAH